MNNSKRIVQLDGPFGEIEVFEDEQSRWLCRDGSQTIHSCMSLLEPSRLELSYQRFMMAWQIFSVGKFPASALVLGLGGGDSVRYLRAHFPDTNITAVEIDADIAKIACEHFLLQPQPDKLQLCIQDAGDFMQHYQQQTDLILLDMLVAEQMPAFMFAQQFWQDCKDALSGNGQIVVNTLLASSDQFSELLQCLQRVFGYLPVCMGVPEHRNVVLLIGSQALAETSIEKLIEVAKSLSADKDIDFMQCVDALARDNKVKNNNIFGV